MASQPEFLLASLAFILLMMIPATTILVNQSYLVFQTRVEESREEYIHQLIYGLLYLPGNPADWGKSSIIPNTIGFSSPYAYGTLDPHKIQRLCMRNLNYLDYQDFSQIMDLKNLRMRIKVLPPFNVSINYNYTWINATTIQEKIIVNVSTWSGSPLPYVDLFIILVKEKRERRISFRPFYIPLSLHRYFYTNSCTGVTNDTGMFELMTFSNSTDTTAVIIVLAKYYDSFFVPAYYNVYDEVCDEDPELAPFMYNSKIKINASFVKKVKDLFQPRYGNFEVNISVSDYLFLRPVINVTTIMISPDLLYLCTNSSKIRIGIWETLGNTSVNVLSRGITFVLIYTYWEFFNWKILRKISIFTWPPFVGYFTHDDPAYGPQLNNTNVIHQEIMSIEGVPCLVVIECEYE